MECYETGRFHCGLWQNATGVPLTVYTIGSLTDSEEIAKRLTLPPKAFVCVDGVDWNRDLSPWPAPKCFRDGEAFAGKADAFLDALIGDILPETERRVPTDKRAVTGYSLAGLFALYALYRTRAFACAASASGSLWFDGWSAYMRAHQPLADVSAVYLSLGKREEESRSARLAAVGDCTREAEALLHRQASRVVLEMNEGGHFQDVTARMVRAVDWLCRAESTRED